MHRDPVSPKGVLQRLGSGAAIQEEAMQETSIQEASIHEAAMQEASIQEAAIEAIKTKKHIIIKDYYYIKKNFLDT